MFDLRKLAPFPHIMLLVIHVSAHVQLKRGRRGGVNETRQDSSLLKKPSKDIQRQEEQ